MKLAFWRKPDPATDPDSPRFHLRLGNLDPATRTAAVTALEAFWGASNGGPKAFIALTESLTALSLSPRQLRSLARGLPQAASGVGTTAQRIKAARLLLEDLADTDN
jgi:hypothetical protein